MLNIGFVDYYLDNWHANNYPAFLREAIARYGYEARVSAASGELVSIAEAGNVGV
jgi:hypothetical protein